MVYETSYESGSKPFRPDATRGNWAAPSDFIYACVGFAFKLDVFSITWLFFSGVGVLALVPYLLSLAVIVVPIMVIQSFIGQFSSSGFISAFRISPIFKGMGYVSLALNVTVLCYYSMFATVPLFFLIHSLRPTLPWSCEGYKSWSGHETGHEPIKTICNITETDDMIIETDTDSWNITDYYRLINHNLPSVLYFNKLFSDVYFRHDENEDFAISWQLMGCNIIIWSIIAGIFYKYFNIEKLGTMIRYGVLITLTLLVICMVRFIFLPGARQGMEEYFSISWVHFWYVIPSIPMYAMTAFGAGWGTIISLASLNKFKTNIMTYSWIICIGQMFLFMAFGMVSFLLERHFTEISDGNFNTYVAEHWALYLSSGSAIAGMELPNMWSILFYSMLTLAALIIMVTQSLTIFVSIFDEYEMLRLRKTEVISGMIGVMAIVSFYFCSNHGIFYFTAFSLNTLFTQTMLNLLLFLMVLWIYGRERFQRDIKFMLGQSFATWKISVLRFFSPIFLIFFLIFAAVISIHEHFFNSNIMEFAAFLFILVPWLAIPGYGIFCIFQTLGSWSTRFWRCCRPTDWYPVDPNERQRYEEDMGNMDITHQLQEVHEDVL